MTIQTTKPKSEAARIIEQMEFKPVELKVPKVGVDIERVELDNGMILYLKEDHRFPLVQVKCITRTGEVYENREKYGVARLTGMVMGSGGTRNLKPDELNQKLEYMAAEIKTNIKTWQGKASLNTIKTQADKALDLFSEVIRYPAFDEQELNLAKNKIREELLRIKDDYQTIGTEYFSKHMYPEHSLGWQYDWNIIKNITREDLVNWHKRFYVPNNMMMAIVGDFDKQEMIDKFKSLFGDWSKKEVNFNITQKTEDRTRPGVYYIKKDMTQAYIIMGNIGIKEGNPDRFALELMNGNFGEGMSSVLFEKIRVLEGLAYRVGSSFQVDSPDYSLFRVTSLTRNDAVIKATLMMKEEIKRMQDEPVDFSTLERVKNKKTNSFVFLFDDPYKTTVRMMMLEYHDRPRDFYETYIENIKKVTSEDIQRAARKYLHPEELTYLFVGDPEKFDQSLSVLGEPMEIVPELTVKTEHD
jgi:zinc protease